MGSPDALAYRSAQGRRVLTATVLASGAAFLDATVVNLALPAVGDDLDAGLAGLQWVVNGYVLALAALILLGGGLGDRLGRRRVFLLGLAGFAGASLLCGLAPTTGLLIAGRVLQGVGGALLTPTSLALLQASFRPEDRGRAIGAWTGLTGVASALGPLAGGWLVETVSWRAVFLLNLPLCAVAAALALRDVPESRDETATGRLDLPGVVLGALALAALTGALITAGDRGAGSPVVVVAAVAGAAAAAAFVVVERRAAQPLLPLGLFADRTFAAANLATLLVYAALSGVLFLLVLTLQVVVETGAVRAGLALLPIPLVLLLLSPRAGALATRTGPRLPMTVGPLVSAVGVLMLVGLDPGTAYATGVLPGVTVFALGLALTVTPLTTAVLAAAPDRYAGTASGVNNAVARTGGLLAVAALPLLGGLSGADYADPAALEPAWRAAALAGAALLVLGAAASAWGVGRGVRPAA